jgi:hypothetical protein
MQTNVKGLGIEHYGHFYPPYDYDGGTGYKYEDLEKAVLAHEPKSWLAIATTNTAQAKVMPFLKKAGWKTIGSTRSSHLDGSRVWLHIYRNKDVEPGKPATGDEDYGIGGCSMQMYVRAGPVFDQAQFTYQLKVQAITRELKLTEVKKMRTHKWRRIAKANAISVWTNAKKDD